MYLSYVVDQVYKRADLGYLACIGAGGPFWSLVTLEWLALGKCILFCTYVHFGYCRLWRSPLSGCGRIRTSPLSHTYTRYVRIRDSLGNQKNVFSWFTGISAYDQVHTTTAPQHTYVVKQINRRWLCAVNLYAHVPTCIDINMQKHMYIFSTHQAVSRCT